MRQLPTNPILARSGAALLLPLTGVYQQDSPSMLPQAHAVPRLIQIFS